MNSFENNQANVPAAGAEARPSETGIVESQISTGQEERGQATTAASAVEPLPPPHLVKGFNNNKLKKQWRKQDPHSKGSVPAIVRR